MPDWIQLDSKAAIETWHGKYLGRLREDSDGVQNKLFLLCTRRLLQIILWKNEVPSL